MHELLRQYAREKLDRGSAVAKAIRDRHCATYCAALQRWEAELKGPRQQAAMAEMEAEIDNARAAWEWAVAGLSERIRPRRSAVEWLGQAMDGLGLFYLRRDRNQEGESTFLLATETLARWIGGAPKAPTGCLPPDKVCLSDIVRPVCANALTWQSEFCLWLGRNELARDLLRQSLDLLDTQAPAHTQAESAHALYTMGLCEMASGNHEKAKQLYMQALALYGALDRRWDVAEILGFMSLAATMQGEYDRAKDLCQEALAIQRVLGDQWGIVKSLKFLVMTSRTLGQFEEAERIGREGLSIARDIGDPALIHTGLNELARVLMWKGEFAESGMLAEEGLRIINNLDAGCSEDYINLMHLLGLTMAHLGRYQEARVHAQQALVSAQAYRWTICFSLLVLGFVMLAEGNHAEAWQYLHQGAAIVRESRDQSNLGVHLAALAGAARELGRLAQARELLCEALELCSATRGGLVPLIALPVTALVLADLGEPERAVEIYALAARSPHVARSRLWEDLAGRRIAALAATLPPEAVAAAQERGRARDTEATIKELSVDLRVDEPVP
jgi:tetratricopeptide (TPR) repeat protein